MKNKKNGPVHLYYDPSHSKKTHNPRFKLKSRVRIVAIALVLIASFFILHKKMFPSDEQIKAQKISDMVDMRNQIRTQITESFLKNEKIDKIKIKENGFLKEVNVNYTFDKGLQGRAEKLLKQYKPDFAAIVAIDVNTGKILALSSFTKNSEAGDNLAIKATYPAASIFKIVPAAVALDKYNLDPDLVLKFNGGAHTLYRKNVMSDAVNKWTRFVSLRDAFAKSVNPVFARLAFDKFQTGDLKEYAEKFYFNKTIETDFPVQIGTATVPVENSYELAEVASGFNQTNKLSPVQGAMIAAAIAGDGVMNMPYIVDSITDEDGKVLYKPETFEISKPLTKLGAQKLRELMSATVTHGTSRKSFKNFLKANEKNPLEVGGKTGSLTCDTLKGKTDWFVGYAIRGNEKIAIAALTVNQEFWTVKSAYLAQDMFRDHFKVINSLTHKPVKKYRNGIARR